jgi:electron transfer flavoprotein beta subunit
VFTGKQTIDGDTAQVGPGIAKRLGLNLLTYVSRIVELDLDARRIKVERRAEGGVQVLDTTLPSLITMLEGTNEMRFASLDDMLRAGRFPVRKWNKDDAGIEDVSKIGLKGSPDHRQQGVRPDAAHREGRHAGGGRQQPAATSR